MCKILQVSRSSYYYWLTKNPSIRLHRRLELGVAIKKIYDWSQGRYGSPRITKELQMQGTKVSRPLVARIMKKKNIRSVTVKRFKQTTNSNHHYGLVENKLSQKFTASNYNQVWVSDITYIKTAEGWLYLTSVIDLFDRKVIGWQLGNSLRAEDTVIPALNKACSSRSAAYFSFRQRYPICL
jgi:transposase InsO family protein